MQSALKLLHTFVSSASFGVGLQRLSVPLDGTCVRSPHIASANTTPAGRATSAPRLRGGQMLLGGFAAPALMTSALAVAHGFLPVKMMQLARGGSVR